MDKTADLGLVYDIKRVNGNNEMPVQILPLEVYLVDDISPVDCISPNTDTTTCPDSQNCKA